MCTARYQLMKYHFGSSVVEEFSMMSERYEVEGFEANPDSLTQKCLLSENKEQKKRAKRPFRAAECDISQVRVVLTIRIPMGQFARQYLLTHNVAKHRVDSDILLRSLRLRLSETA